MRDVLFALVSLVASSAFVQAQQRWIVDGSNASRFDAVFAAAAPGDVILIRVPILPAPPNHQFYLGDKGVTIRGDGVRRPELRDNVSVTRVPAGQTMLLENLRLTSGASVYDNVGAVILRDMYVQERGTFYPADAPLSVWDSAQVLALDCESHSVPGTGCGMRPHPGLRVERSRMVLTRCLLAGNPFYVARCEMPLILPYPGWFDYGVPEGAGVEALDASVLLFDTYVHRPYAPAPSTEVTNTRLVASPPPSQWILGHPGTGPSEVHLYGLGAGAGGSVVLTQNARLLPSTRATLAGDRLRLEVRNGSSDSPGFMGIGLQPAHVLLAPFGHHGAILLPTDRSQSALFDTFTTDATGTWTREYVVPQPLLTQLLDHYFVFQALMLDPSQTIWAGSPDVVRF